MIEAFKIVDLPNVMTNGGPGTATQSLTYHAYINLARVEYRRFGRGSIYAALSCDIFCMIFVKFDPSTYGRNL